MKYLCAFLLLVACGDADAQGFGGNGFDGSVFGAPPGFVLSCGDGRLSGGETCDDSNKTGGDGCSSTCTVEDRYTCLGSPSTCTRIACGDGVVTRDEQCDDGNNTASDGCSATCTVEAGAYCTGTAPSVCTTGIPGSPTHLFISDNVDGKNNAASATHGLRVATWTNTGSVSGDATQSTAALKPVLNLDSDGTHDAVYFDGRGSGNSSVAGPALAIGSSTTGLKYIWGTDIFDIWIRVLPGDFSRGNMTIFGNGPLSNNDAIVVTALQHSGRLAVIIRSGGVYNVVATSGPVLAPFVAQTIEVKGDATTLTMCVNTTCATDVFSGAVTNENGQSNVSIGTDIDYTGSFTGDMLALAFYSTVQNQATMRTAFSNRFPTTTLSPIVVMGDSTTNNPAAGGINIHPSVLQTTLTSVYNGKKPVFSSAVGGNALTQMDSRFTTDIAGKGAKYGVILGGSESINTGGVALTTVIANLDTLVADMVADGEVVCLLTLLPRNGQAGWTIGNQVDLLAVNAHILTLAATSVKVFNAYADFDDGAGAIKSAYNGTADGETVDGIRLGTSGHVRLAADVKVCLGL